jgi:hypothetical protein
MDIAQHILPFSETVVFFCRLKKLISLLLVWEML